MKRKYGYIRDLKDQRDILYKATKPFVIPLPDSIDLRDFCPPVGDQGSLGSCVLNAAMKELQFLQLRHWKEEIIFLSRLFSYYNTREIEGTLGEDSGCQIRNAIKSLTNIGVCAESLWPYVIGKFKDKPTQDCYEEASARKISRYERLSTLEDMLQCLAEGYPFIFGVTIYESFESEEAVKTGNVPMPVWNERSLGGHAMLCVGYNVAEKTFLFSNSWGEDYGEKGYGKLSFDYMMRFLGDAWVVIE